MQQRHYKPTSCRRKGLSRYPYRNSYETHDHNHQHCHNLLDDDYHFSTRTTSESTIDAPPAANNVDVIPNCPHCDCNPTSHIGLIGHLRIHSIETG
ncbi:hypothetical protein SprV_0200701300 [Sparganum proliferum]